MEERADISEPKTVPIPVRLDDNTIIYIEARPLAPDQGYIASIEPPSFQQVTDTIKSMAKSLVTIWDEVHPSKASVEFGVEVGFEPGNLTALLVKGSGKGNLTVTLEWGKQSSE